MEEMASEKTMKEVEAGMSPVNPVKEEKPKKEITHLQIIGLTIIMAIVLGAAIVVSNLMVLKTITNSISDQVKTQVVPIVRQSIQKDVITPASIEATVKKAVKEAVEESIKQRIIQPPFHIVAKNETLTGISRYYNINLKALEKANEDILKSTKGVIYPGMGLRLP